MHATVLHPGGRREMRKEMLGEALGEVCRVVEGRLVPRVETRPPSLAAIVSDKKKGPGKSRAPHSSLKRLITRCGSDDQWP